MLISRMRLRCASAVRALPQEEEERGRRGGHADTGGVDGRLGQRSGRDGERGPAPPLSDRSTRCVLVSRSDARCLEPSAFSLYSTACCVLLPCRLHSTPSLSLCCLLPIDIAAARDSLRRCYVRTCPRTRTRVSRLSSSRLIASSFDLCSLLSSNLLCFIMRIFLIGRHSSLGLIRFRSSYLKPSSSVL